MNDIELTKYKILVVDDIVANTTLVKSVLSPLGYQMLTANDGIVALEVIKKDKPDLILLDVMMPNMDGHEVVKRLKANPDTKDIPVIFITALNDVRNIVRGFEFGAGDYIVKPFDINVLRVRVLNQIKQIYFRNIILEQQDKLKEVIANRDRLYSVVTHDLRSPLGTMRMILDLLASSLTEDGIGIELYDMLVSVDRMAHDSYDLLDNILKWIKNQRKELLPCKTDIDVVALFRSEMEVFSRFSKVKDLKLNLFSQENSFVNADVDLLKTVFRNILSNAVKFSKIGGNVDITISELGKFIKIEIKDYGVGISEEAKEKILDKDVFYTTFGTANEEGFGLGLRLCYDFVRLNNGKLWFESEEGKYSIFSFTIPKSLPNSAVK